jgi:NAD(P)-dependent dehydrogenase (short-subunit alcohol dehydrogenase family)
VNTLCPTFIETPMTRPFLQDPTFRASVVSKIKLGRIGKLEDLMGAAVFLASDAAALMTPVTDQLAVILPMEFANVEYGFQLKAS